MHTEKEAGPGHIPLVVSVYKVLWGSCATCSYIGHFNPKQPGFGNLTEVSSKGHIGIQVLGVREDLITRVVLGSYICFCLCYCCLGHELAFGTSVSFMSLQASWPNTTGAKAAIPWNSLVKLSTSLLLF